METTTELKTVAPTNNLTLGSIVASTPAEIIETATSISRMLCKVIEENKLYVDIGQKKYVTVEGWTTLGALLGITPREVSVEETDKGDYIAIVELVRGRDGAVIGRASALVGQDERTWRSRPSYAKRSMAITRATGKAFRLAFSFIMTLSGYAPTPAEEMPQAATEKFKEVVVIVDRDKLKQEMFECAKKDGEPGMRKYYADLHPTQKKAFPSKDWASITQEILASLGENEDIPQ